MPHPSSTPPQLGSWKVRSSIEYGKVRSSIEYGPFG